MEPATRGHPLCFGSHFVEESSVRLRTIICVIQGAERSKRMSPCELSYVIQAALVGDT